MRAPHGVWTVKILADSGRSARVHAWIQRDDSAPGRGPESRGHRGRQSYFLDTFPDNAPGPVEPSGTINAIATFRPKTADRLWVVGAMRRDDCSLSGYSAAGPTRADGACAPASPGSTTCNAPAARASGSDATRCDGPDIVTLADDSLNLPGLLVGGVLSGSRLRVSGTSIAAALFTRQLHHVLANQKGGHSVLELTNFAAVRSPSRPVKVAAGAPTVADPLFRGERMRMPMLPALQGDTRLPACDCAAPSPAPATSAPAAAAAASPPPPKPP